MADLIERQAAIDEIMALIEEPDDDFNEGVRNSAVVIYQLPSAQTNALDCVSRQAAINAICKACSLSGDYQKCDGYPEESTWCEELVALRALPSAQPRKKGKWINHRNDDGHNIADCDQCGNALQWFDGDEVPRYCCMCGADMRGDEMIYPQVDGITPSII